MILNSPTISGSLIVSGSLTVTGTATVTASNATSASYAASASNALSASNAVTAQTASYANAFTVGGTLTAQTLVVQTITSSVDFVTGSTRFGSLISNTHTFTGSVYVTGAFYVTTGSVGIGTTSPSNLLHVYGTDGNSYIRWTSDVATTGTRIGYNGTEFRIDQQQNADITLRTSGSERMRITNGGDTIFSPYSYTFSANSAYKHINFGGSALMYRDAVDAYINSNANFNSSNAWQAKYTTAEALGVATFSGGNFTWSSFSGSVTAGSTYAIVDRFKITAVGNVAIGTSTIGTEANLHLGAFGANEGGQLILQKATSYASASHLDNYQNRFRIMSGTDTTSSTERLSVDMTNGDLSTNGGQIYSTSTIISIPNSATTIFTSTGTGGVWLVSYAVSGNPAQVGYAIVGNAFGSTLTLLASTAGSQTALSVSGLNLQLSQSAGGSINTRVNVIKLATTYG